MPIRFRCAYCNRLLGIATRKAGTETTCPHCGYTITVPVPPEAEERTARMSEEDARTERISLDDVDEMLGNTAVEPAAAGVAARVAAPAEQPKSAPVPHGPEGALPPMAAPIALPPPPLVPKVTRPPVVPKGTVEPKAPAAPKPVPKPYDPNDPPLFEGDVDEILGATAAPEEPERAKKPAVSGMDAMSLGEPARHIVISAQKATLLMVLFVVSLVVAFAAGYFLAPRG
jgi:phage FluMu protein Com